MKRRMLAAASVILLAACSEAPTAPEPSDFRATPAFSVTDLVGPNDITYGMLHGSVRFWNTQITAVSAGTFAGNAALVEPGASISLSGTFQVGPATDLSYCPGCIIQTYVAWVPNAAANGATPFNKGLRSGGNTSPYPGPVTNFTWTTNAPTVPGTYYIGKGETWDYIYQWWAQGGMGGVTGNTSQSAASFIIQVRANPSAKSDCFNGGWQYYEFKNQGQCVRYIETGKDSR